MCWFVIKFFLIKMAETLQYTNIHFSIFTIIHTKTTLHFDRNKMEEVTVTEDKM